MAVFLREREHPRLANPLNAEFHLAGKFDGQAEHTCQIDRVGVRHVRNELGIKGGPIYLRNRLRGSAVAVVAVPIARWFIRSAEVPKPGPVRRAADLAPVVAIRFATAKVKPIVRATATLRVRAAAGAWPSRLVEPLHGLKYERFCTLRLVKISDLLKWNQNRIQKKKEKSKSTTRKLVRIPILGTIPSKEPLRTEGRKVWITTIQSDLSGDDLFAVVVEGNLYEDEHIKDGDVIVVRKNQNPPPGCLVFARSYPGTDAYTLFRYFVRMEDGNVFVNLDGSEFRHEESRPTIVGHVVSVYREIELEIGDPTTHGVL